MPLGGSLGGGDDRGCTALQGMLTRDEGRSRGRNRTSVGGGLRPPRRLRRWELCLAAGQEGVPKVSRGRRPGLPTKPSSTAALRMRSSAWSTAPCRLTVVGIGGGRESRRCRPSPVTKRSLMFRRRRHYQEKFAGLSESVTSSTSVHLSHSGP